MIELSLIKINDGPQTLVDLKKEKTNSVDTVLIQSSFHWDVYDTVGDFSIVAWSRSLAWHLFVLE